MNFQSLSQSIRMFKSVLDGETYAAIALEFGLARSAVERRVKAVARELQYIVGVEGVDENESPNAALLRTHRSDYLEALEHYHPYAVAPSSTKRLTLSDDDIEHALATISLRSKHKKRDAALLLILLATAARPIEIARLEVRDYLNEDGSVREESLLRAEAAVSGRVRPLFFASKKLIDVIDEYLEERVRRRGIYTRRSYRGLDPHSRLFLTDEGLPMAIRVSEGARQPRHFCRAILDIYQRIFTLAGLKGVSALSARRTVARRLAERGCNLEQIGEVLGVKGRSAVRNLLVRRPPPLRAAIRELV